MYIHVVRLQWEPITVFIIEDLLVLMITVLFGEPTQLPVTQHCMCQTICRIPVALPSSGSHTLCDCVPSQQPNSECRPDAVGT